MKATFPTMGSVASLTVDAPIPTSLMARVKEIFSDYDSTFSLYLPDSALSRIARQELELESSPQRVRDEYARAVDWRDLTLGWFTPHRPDGVLDLSGTIKAVAIADAASTLAAAGAEGLIGVGGDIAAVGAGPRLVGVIDPHDRSRIIADAVLDRRRAIATSGSTERGDHIWTRLGSTDILQASVLADDIVTADVLATALVAAGSAHMQDLLDSFDIDALIVSRTGLFATPGWPRQTPTLIP